MSRHQKKLTKKQKIIIYVSCAAAAVVAAIIAVIILVHTVKNPPAIIFNSNSASYTSNLSDLVGSSGIIVPEATITITPEGNNEKVENIIEAAQNIEQTKQNTVVVKTSTIDTSGLQKRQVKIPVQFLAQNPELPTGCEITSLTTVLNYYGYNVSKTEMSDEYLDKTVDKIGNFWEVFVGNPRKNGFGCYAKPIVNAANRYLATQNSRYKAVDYSGTEFEDLLGLVEKGTPVIIWSTMYGEEENNLRTPYATVKWSVDGQNLQWISPEHCMVLIGYDLDRNVAIVSDPQRGIVEYDLNTVKARYLALYSQCVVFEEIPVINGIENGATYYTTRYVTVADYNLQSVTVNGTEKDTAFFIYGNAVNMYVIEATDADGNTITYTIYTKPIKSLLDPIADLSEFTVTADQRDTIETVKNSAFEIDTSYSPPLETKLLDEVVNTCDKLLNKITEVQDELDRIAQAISDYETNKPENADNKLLIDLESDIEVLLAGNNLTSAQRTTLNSLKTKCHNWMDDAP